MKIRVKDHTVTALNNLKNLWLLRDNDIMIIRDVTYETDNKDEEPKQDDEPLPINTKRYVRKKDRKKPESKTYVTAITIEGYHPDLKFIGTYNEDYCTRLIESHDDPHYTLNLLDFRKAWTRLKEQIDAFEEAKQKAEEPKEKEEEQKDEN